MGMEQQIPNSKIINDKEKAEHMAHFSNTTHTIAAELRSQGDAGSAETMEHKAEKREDLAAVEFDEQKKAEGMTYEELELALAKANKDRTIAEIKLKILQDAMRNK
jgi:hypothetical protein